MWSAPCGSPLRFDTPHTDWPPERHAAEMAEELKNQRRIEPNGEYQIARALENNGHDLCCSACTTICAT